MAERVSIVTEITFNLLATLYCAVDKSGYTPSPNIKKLTLMKCRIMFPFSPFKNKTLSFYFVFLESEVSSLNQYELVAFPSSSLGALTPSWDSLWQEVSGHLLLQEHLKSGFFFESCEIYPRVVLHLGVGKHRSLARWLVLAGIH